MNVPDLKRRADYYRDYHRLQGLRESEGKRARARRRALLQKEEQKKRAGESEGIGRGGERKKGRMGWDLRQ
jgi:hypothetical protein